MARLDVDPRDEGHDACAVLRAEDLRMSYAVNSRGGSRRREVHALRGVTLEVPKGKTVGVVGESGCGKSTLGRILVGLEQPTSGRVLVHDRDIAQVDGKQRGDLLHAVQMVFQSPFTSLDPRMSVLQIIREPLDIVRRPARKSERNDRAKEVMKSVGLPSFLESRRPGALSGGQQQRVGLARALATGSEVIVCDEPVSSLDVAIQAQVINLLQDIQNDVGVAYVFIAHDLGVVATISDYVAVMYLGKIVEYGATNEVYDHPQHPFTKALMSSAPVPEPNADSRVHRVVLQGELPSPEHVPTGCPFRTRCWKAGDICAQEDPGLAVRGTARNHEVACHFPEAY